MIKRIRTFLWLLLRKMFPLKYRAGYCIGCDKWIAAPAAFAIMHARDFSNNGLVPTFKGPKNFHAGPVCLQCHYDERNTKRHLKAHFCAPDQVELFLERAGGVTIG